MFKQRFFLALLLGSASLFTSRPAMAAELVFTGAASATAVVRRDASCAPLPFRGIATGPGTSTLGAFTYSHNACTQGATGPVNGTFSLDFGGSLIEGTFEGFSVARDGVAGLFDQQFNYIVSSGTGLFQGATGSFTNIGTVDVRGGPPSRLSLNFNGLINAPAVPEPATWAMVLIGFGAIGGVMRAGRRGRKICPPSTPVAQI